VTGDPSHIQPPVLFAPNHTSNLDTIALLAAVPRRIRDRIAPAVSQDYFLPYLSGTGNLRQRLSLGLQYVLGVILINVFPLPQSTTGVRETLRFAGLRADRGDSILIFPEGRRTPDGDMHGFRAGVGLLAVSLQIPVVPVYIEGLYDVLPAHASWPVPAPVRVRFGEPMRFDETEDYRAATTRIEEAVRALGRIS
jgi:long-chain acyl-CoA synthetase